MIKTTFEKHIWVREGKATLLEVRKGVGIYETKNGSIFRVLPPQFSKKGEK